MYRKFGKTLIDISLAIIIIMIIFPFLLLITLMLFTANHGKPFFIQSRPGKHGKLFHIIKFKTMRDKKDENGILLSDSERLIPLGKLIRRTSFDETLQLINVIKGEMSLVGPRPLLPEYLPLYSPHQARRHEVLPGITGWAQTHGRNELSWEEKFEMDVWYVDNLSFILDMKIIFLTAIKVFKREGINSANAATMERFTGS